MNRYFSTFITGFSAVVEELLQQHLPDVKIEQVLDGLVIYQTSTSASQIAELPFFNNSYWLVQTFEKLGDKPLGQMMSWLKDQQSIALPQGVFKDKRSVKVILSEENQYLGIHKDTLAKVEQKVAGLTHLKADRQHGEIEFWFLSRKEQLGLIGIRLTYKGDYEKLLKKGELRPELCYLLCSLSEPQPDDVFLDPFSGSGAIPLCRAQWWPAAKIIAGEKDSSLIGYLRQRSQQSQQVFEVQALDATNLEHFEDNSISAVVTDPPWGLHFNQALNINHFYRQLLEQLGRVIKSKGRIVLVTAQKELLTDLLAEHSQLELKQTFNTLISGQKAAVYKLIKR